MYGVCHKGVEKFVRERFGEQVWSEVRVEADIRGDIELEAYYEDALSTRVFTALEEKFELDIDKILFEFGVYWVGYARNTNLRALLADASSFTEMLDSLNDIHARMKLMLPKMRPPHFEIEEHDDMHLTLHYRSTREGLAPMVEGLVVELAKVFERDIEVEQTQYRDKQGDSHDVFEIHHKPAVAKADKEAA